MHELRLRFVESTGSEDARGALIGRDRGFVGRLDASRRRFDLGSKIMSPREYAASPLAIARQNSTQRRSSCDASRDIRTSTLPCARSSPITVTSTLRAGPFATITRCGAHRFSALSAVATSAPAPRTSSRESMFVSSASIRISVSAGMSTLRVTRLSPGRSSSSRSRSRFDGHGAVGLRGGRHRNFAQRQAGQRNPCDQNELHAPRLPHRLTTRQRCGDWSNAEKMGWGDFASQSVRMTGMDPPT